MPQVPDGLIARRLRDVIPSPVVRGLRQIPLVNTTSLRLLVANHLEFGRKMARMTRFGHDQVGLVAVAVSLDLRIVTEARESLDPKVGQLAALAKRIVGVLEAGRPELRGNL